MKTLYVGTRWLGLAKANWGNKAGRVRPGLAGKGGSGQEVLARLGS